MSKCRDNSKEQIAVSIVDLVAISLIRLEGPKLNNYNNSYI